MNRLCIIVLNYKDYRATGDCLSSIYQSDLPRNFQIYVIDNSKNLKKQQLLAKQFPRAVLIKNKHNLGFAKGNNLGLKLAIDNNASHLLIVNPDVIIPKKFFKRLISHLNNNHGIGLIAPGHLHRNKITLGGHLNRCTGVAKHDLIPHNKTRYSLTFHDYVSFACVLIKSKVIIKMGYLNERYFMYFEDVEYCLNLKKGGFHVACDPSILISHQISSSFSSPVKKLRYLIPSHFRFIINNLTGFYRVTALIYQSFHYPYLYLLWTYHHWRYSSNQTE